MKLWGDMTRIERARAVVYWCRKRGRSYGEVADMLVASRGAIAGALARAEGYQRRKPGRKPGFSQPDKYAWTEKRLTEPWAQWAARRKAERMAAREQA